MTFSTPDIIQKIFEGKCSEIDFDEAMRFCSETYKQPLMHFIIDHTSPTQCQEVIHQLLTFAANHKHGLFHTLLTTPNELGLIPYYYALYNPYIPEFVAQQLSAWQFRGKSMHLLSTSDYVDLYLDTHPINMLVTVQQNEERLLIALKNVSNIRIKGWISEQQYASFFQLQMKEGVRLVDIITNVGHPNILKFMFDTLGAIAWPFKYSAIYFRLHNLIVEGKSDELEACFKDLHQAVAKKRLSSEIYPTILFYSSPETPNLLSTSFHPCSKETSQVILQYVEIAFNDGLIREETYGKFLIDHTDINSSPLQNALYSSSYKNVYVYISKCLQAIYDGVLSLSSFKAALTKQNLYDGTFIFQQAFNNLHIQTTELFLNLFKLLFSREEYFRVLTLSLDFWVKTHPLNHQLKHLVGSELLKIKRNITSKYPFIYFGELEREKEGLAELKNLIDLIHGIMPNRYVRANSMRFYQEPPSNPPENTPRSQGKRI